jgi:hypothetical protein
MSIFGKIMGAIFGNSAAAQPNQAGPAPGTSSAGGSTAPSAANPSGVASSQQSGSAAGVDVAAIVDKAAAGKGEKLNWKTSIVDL